LICPDMKTCARDFRHGGIIRTFHQCKAKYGEDCTPKSLYHAWKSVIRVGSSARGVPHRSQNQNSLRMRKTNPGDGGNSDGNGSQRGLKGGLGPLESTLTQESKS
jgi:hypothetical protein